MLNVKSSREAVNSNFKAIGLTRLGIKPESTAQEADALTTRPSELFRLASLFNLNHVDYRDVPRGKLLGLAE